MKASCGQIFVPIGEKRVTPDGYHVVFVRVGDLPAAAMDPDGDCYEARMAGSVSEPRFLIGAITCGGLSLLLFENAVGGHVQADALLEVVV